MEIIQGTHIALQSQIYYLTSEILKDTRYFEEHLCGDMTNSYYWSDNWSEDFYIELSKAGFISTSHETKDGLILLPELQSDYAILDFKNLHISQKVKKLMRESDYELCMNSMFHEVVEKFSTHHKYNWLKGEYAKLIKKLYLHNDAREDFKVVSFELVDKSSRELIAGEVGYIIANTYTSLSGFSSREKKYANYGTLQLVLLAQHLEKNGFDFWNLGHPHMQYKQRLGCETYSRSDFLEKWRRATQIS